MATYTGGSGNDTYSGGSHSDSISGNAGNDTLYGGGGSDTVSGGDGSDSLFGGSSGDRMDGGEGNDILDGGTSGDSIAGGGGDDTVDLTGTFGSDTIAGGETGETSGDVLDASGLTSGVTVTFSGSEAGTITDGSSTASFSQMENFTLTDQADSLNGAAGSGPVAVDAGAGNDTISGGSGGDTLDGGAGADSISGNAGNDLITGGGGSPIGTTYIENGDFNAGSSGWTGNDIEADNTESAYMGGSSSNRVAEIDGDEDETTVMQQSFTVDGAQTAQLSLNAVVRTAGDVGTDGVQVDVLDASGSVIGTTTIYPTSNTTWGNYTLDFSFPSAGTYTLRLTELGNDDSLGVIVDNIQITATSASSDEAADTLSGGDGLDTILGGGGADSITGGAGADSLSGEAGNDTISGDGDADQIFGGDGADSLTGGSGSDQLSGGSGADSLYGGADGDTLSGDAGADLAYGGDGGDSLSGGSEADTLHGDAGADTLAGDAGADSLYGGTEADSLSGGENNDQLFGGDGVDTLDGGDGNDVMDGGAGADVFQVGAGSDTLYGGAGAEILDGGTDADVIYGGDDQDTVLGGIGDVADGGSGGVDEDVLDLSVYGWSRTDVSYDPANPENGTVTFYDASGNSIGSMGFSNIEHVLVCFTPGTRITTDHGEVPVEHLAEGDRVFTRDNGYQVLRWVGWKSLSAADLVVNPALRPIRITAGALGAGLPERDMKVSPQHRMLFAGARAEMLFSESEVLVAARHLTHLPGVDQVMTAGITYIHLLFDGHEIFRADGAWTESFQPAARSFKAMDEATRAEIATLFPDIEDRAAAILAARPTLKAHEARVLLPF